jgi:hypothetical protein
MGTVHHVHKKENMLVVKRTVSSQIILNQGQIVNQNAVFKTSPTNINRQWCSMGILRCKLEIVGSNPAPEAKTIGWQSGLTRQSIEAYAPLPCLKKTLGLFNPACGSCRRIGKVARLWPWCGRNTRCGFDSRQLPQELTYLLDLVDSKCRR